jgi:hypothetical protein
MLRQVFVILRQKLKSLNLSYYKKLRHLEHCDIVIPLKFYAAHHICR